MTVMSKSTKGKKERIALAATEKANVCTSVRNRYFTVAATNPEYGSSGGSGASEWVAGGGGFASLDFKSSSIFPNPIRQLHFPSHSEGHGSPRLSGRHFSSRSRLLLDRFEQFEISLLARNGVHEYYLVLAARFLVHRGCCLGNDSVL